MNLTTTPLGKMHIIKSIKTNDPQLDAFLFSLGCYSGEPVSVINRKKSGCIISIKNSRYSIDTPLAKVITVE